MKYVYLHNGLAEGIIAEPAGIINPGSNGSKCPNRGQLRPQLTLGEALQCTELVHGFLSRKFDLMQ